MNPSIHNTAYGRSLFINAFKRLLRLWIVVATCGVWLMGISVNSWAQDLAVDWVTAAPIEGAAGDSVTLQGRIVNNGPGTAFSIQYQWYLSADAQISTDDMALGDIITSNEYLYADEGTIVSDTITVPAFADPIAPSYFGLMIYYLFPPFDDDPENNTGSAAFTYTGDPPHGFYDTVGDNYLDAIYLSAEIVGTSLEVAVTFSQPPTSSVTLMMGIDLDQDPATTGENSTLPGSEAVLDLAYQELTPGVVTLKTDTGTFNLAGATVDGNTLSYTVPLGLIGNDAAMDLFWVVDHMVEPTADFDRAPDAGVYATDTEAVVVRRPGDESIQVMVTDPAEGNFPDIRQLEGRVAGDQLQLTLTYAHSVDVTSVPLLGDGLFVWIDLDSDGRLATGFANSGQTPPAMGIDHQLRLQIDDLAGIVPELLKDTDGDGEQEAFPMGLPFNDMFMRLDDNRIILRIPLAYLDHSDGAGALAVTSLDTRNILTGTIDRLPDECAWDFKTDALLPGQSCLAASREVADPGDDSLFGAGGLDNDELVHASFCLGNQAILFAIDYESYLLSNNGATLIHLDTDRNPDTGKTVTNLAGDTTIGADYVLRSYWDYDELRQITHLYRAVPPESVATATQLSTPTLANRLYLTLPLESIGSPAGPVNILVRTASWAGGGSSLLLANDDLPDSGVVTLATVPGGYAGDLDADGDVDGIDLAMLVNTPVQMALVDFLMDFGRARQNRQVR